MISDKDETILAAYNASTLEDLEDVNFWLVGDPKMYDYPRNILIRFEGVERDADNDTWDGTSYRERFGLYHYLIGDYTYLEAKEILKPIINSTPAVLESDDMGDARNGMEIGELQPVYTDGGLLDSFVLFVTFPSVRDTGNPLPDTLDELRLRVDEVSSP
jgi:hypothetical protein